MIKLKEENIDTIRIKIESINEIGILISVDSKSAPNCAIINCEVF